MKPKLMIFFVGLFVFWGSFSGTTQAAQKTGKRSDANWKRHISEDVRIRGDEESPVLSPVTKYPAHGVKGPSVTCEDIHPGMGDEHIANHSYIGHTWYEFQKNGSMGRMMSVTSAGVRHFSWMWTGGPYTEGAPNWRYVDANEMSAGGVFVGQQHVDGGTNKNAGYSNQAHLSDGKSVVSYHRVAGQIGDPKTDAMLAIEDAVGTATFTRHWDIPDSILNAPSNQPGEWPKIAVQYDDVSGKEYIHVVFTESELTAGYPVMQAYIRCYLSADPNVMICESPRPGSAPVVYTLNKNVNYSDPHNLVAHFDTTCSITATPHVSPVSKRLAVVYQPPCNCDGSCDYLNDIAFIESRNCGNDWVDGTNYPPASYNITNYGCTYPADYRAYHDHGACYDYNDSLHIIWSTVGFPDLGSVQPGKARLWHWSKATGISQITSAIWGDTDPGAHNANIAKMSISAKDPMYHPGGNPDSVYLFCIWTQFDTNTSVGGLQDNSDAGYTNGEIYGVGSNDGGLSWGIVYNLTQTHTPNCTPDNCVSEHWSSLAENMYDGDLHIQYVCDRYAGAAIQDGTDWGDTYMYYLHLQQWDVGARCEGAYNCVEPLSFHRPAMKMSNGDIKVLTLNVANVGNLQMPYTATASDPQGCITGSYSAVLVIAEDVDLTFTVSAVGACGGGDDGNMIIGGIELTTCDETVMIPVHAVVAKDYYECPTDPVTFDTVETSALRLYANANGLEWIHDVSSWPDTVHEVFSRGGPFVATSIDGNKVVGRWYGENDWRAGVRDKLYYDYNDYGDDYDCHLLYANNIFIHYPPTPPYIYHCYWWWWEWSKVIKVCELPDFRKIVIKYIRVKRHDPPTWWPAADPPQGPYDGHEDTYIGMMMDIDCPFDTLGDENARNLGGYETGAEVAWQRGYYHAGDPEGHPEYEYYYAGMALADPSGTGDIVPYGAHILKNNYYLYPQGGWGWKEDQFYDLASTAGPTNQDLDSLVDRSIVLTAKHIPAGNDPDADYSFVVVEVMTKDGKDAMLALVDSARAWVLRHPVPLYECGDVDHNGRVDLGDAITLENYLFKDYPEPDPFLGADCNGDYKVDVADMIYLIDYLFEVPSPPLNCPGYPGYTPPSYGVDPYNPDTVYVRVEEPKVTSGGVDVPVTLWFSNDEDLHGLAIPFCWTGEAYLDYAKNTTDIWSEYYIFRDLNRMPNRLRPHLGEGGWAVFWSIDSLSDAAYLIPWGPSPISPGSGLLATFTYTCSQPPTPEIDTCFYPPSHELLFIEPDNNYFVPQFLGWDPVNCNTSFSDPSLVLCPLGDIPFRVYLRDSYGNPVAGYSNVWLDFSGCSGIVPCAVETSWPFVYPEGPSDQNGMITFRVHAGGCDDYHQVQVKSKCGLIQNRLRAVKTVDADGDLVVRTNDWHGFGVDPCNDLNCSGEVNFWDLDFFREHLGHSCVEDQCLLLNQDITVSPDTLLTLGQVHDVRVLIQNYNAQPCSGRVDLFWAGFDAGTTLHWFAGRDLPRKLTNGDTCSVRADFVVPGYSSGYILSELSTGCCAHTIDAIFNFTERICPPQSMLYMFPMHLATVPAHIETLDYLPDTPGWYWFVYETGGIPDSVAIVTPSSSTLGETGGVTLYFYDQNWNLLGYRTCEVRITLNSGDVTSDCTVNIGDVVALLNYLFKGGNEPDPIRAGDVNCDCILNLGDAIYLLNYLFKSGTPPVSSETCECGYKEWFPR